MSRFRDRRDAGRQLAAALARFRGSDPAIFALPRGGVPVAYEVARALSAPLDLVLVRKIGAPGQREFGLGAVAEGGVMAMDAALVRAVAPPPGYVEAETARELAEMRRREQCYAGARVAVPVGGRMAIVIDDGVATGGTARAALRSLRQRGAARLVLALPVVAPESLEALRMEADEIVFLHAPARMSAVGAHYDDFAPTSDAEVSALLIGARQSLP